MNFYALSKKKNEIDFLSLELDIALNLPIICIVQGDTKKRELLKCVVAMKECIRGGGRHIESVIFKH